MSKEYNGDPIDASWQTAPWNNDGETIDAHDSEGDGEIMTIDWPENATDREDLNENQRRLITTAARYPSVEEPEELLDLAGLDMSYGYPQQTLINHWPERYWGKTPNGIEVDHNSDDENARWDDITKERVEKIRRRLLTGGSAMELENEYSPSTQRICNIAKGELDEVPNCGIPPLKYVPKEHEWVTVDEFGNNNSEEANDGQDIESRSNSESGNEQPAEGDISVEELRRRALNGENAQSISENVDLSDRTISKRLSGNARYDDPNSNIPPLEYDHSNERWKMPEGGENNRHDDETPDETPDETHSVTPDPVRHTPEPESSPLPSWVWAVVGAAFMWLASKLRN